MGSWRTGARTRRRIAYPARMPPRFDLQSHSTHSDGELSAAEVVERAAKAGVELLALTDHDTVTGVSEALAAGERFGVHVVPAVEISSIDDGAQAPRELHILGYAIDYVAPTLSKHLAEFLADREQRTLRMAAALRELGWRLDESELKERLEAGRPIGRPHVAGAVLSSPDNASRLKAEQIDDVGSLIRAYLIEGRPAFRLRETPTTSQSPRRANSFTARIADVRAQGIDGVEAFYVTHTPEQTALLAERCAELGLLSTGSADFHGPDNRIFSSFLAFDTYGHEPNLGRIAEQDGG